MIFTKNVFTWNEIFILRSACIYKRNVLVYVAKCECT